MMTLKNSRVLRMILLSITICLFSFSAHAKYSSGSGTEDEPYQIATAEDLMLLGESTDDYDKHFILTADIDLNPNLPGRKVFDKAVIAPDLNDANPSWQSDGIPFTGVLDGNGHTVSHLTVVGEGILGLFGQLGSGAKIYDLGLEAVDIDGNKNCVGGLVGHNDNGNINTSYSTGTVNGFISIGGLVGDNDGMVTRSNSTCTVNGYAVVGGLVGSNAGGISTSYSTGMVSSARTGWYIGSAGGLVGANEGEITTSYSTGTVGGGRYVGGLVGTNGGSIVMSYCTGAVNGNNDVGGLVGSNSYLVNFDYGYIEGKITSSFWDMETSGQATSEGGTGKTTTEMKMASFYLDVGWDFVGEANNGTEDIWKISEGLDYPRLWWEPSKYSGGTGEPNNPYQIATAEDLILLGESTDDYDKHFILTADIDLNPNLPGGRVFDRAIIAPDTNDVRSLFQGTTFTGVFDGNGHIISNITIKGEDYLGLFGELGSKAKIYNLGLVEADVNGIGDYIGGLVGRNGGSIITSYSTGMVSGDDMVGGLAGINVGSIAASYSTGMVRGNGAVGGLVGYNIGSISNCYSTATVSGSGSFEGTGGLVGTNGGRIITSYSTGMVSSDDMVGGLVGRNSTGFGEPTSRRGNINSSFWNMETSGQATSDGGIGLTTTEMRDIDTCLSAGWDFVDEIHNGTCDYWQISTGDYPRLRYHAGDIPVMPEGLGTAQEPYLIRDARDLGTVWFKPQAHYCLEASLDLSGITWSMAVVPWFEGTFDGNGHVISNLRIQGANYLGLFGKLRSGARISNLGLEDVDVKGTGGYVGGLVGSNDDWQYKAGILTNCYTTGTVTGSRHVGGLVGDNDYDGSITSCYSTGTVTGNRYVGGLVGSNRWHSSITSCSSTSDVGGDNYTGGLVGQNGGWITTSYSTGTVSGDSVIGGLVGCNYIDLGAIVGLDLGRITTSYSTSMVTGNNIVGGLVGDNDYGNIASSFWDIEASGQSSSPGGIGLTTAQMQDVDMYLSAGWDFVDEILNGTCDYWQISPSDYPRLHYHTGLSPVMPEGLGTTDEPYLIQDATDLGTVWFEPTAHYRLGTHVDLSGITWSLAVIPWFDGVFDGNGHVISNLRIQGADYLGLFGQLRSGAKISSLGLEAVEVDGTGHFVGSLVGRNEGSITTSYSTGTFNGFISIGGLVGLNDRNGSITMSYSRGNASGHLDVGGLVGNNSGGDISLSYSTSTVSGDTYVGGLIGDNNGSVNTSYSIGTVTGDDGVGGLVGDSFGGDVIKCFWDVQTSSSSVSDGRAGWTTAEMQTASTFLDAGWDFVEETANGTEDIWWIDEGQDYPRLWWELIPEN